MKKSKVREKTKGNKKVEVKPKTSKKLNKKIVLPVLILLGVILFLTNIYLIKTVFLFKDIETPLRIVFCLLAVDIVAIFTTVMVKLNRSKSAKAILVLAVILLAYSGSIAFASSKVNGLYQKIDDMTEGTTTTNSFTTYLIVPTDSNLTGMEDAKKGKIGYIKDEENVATYELPKKIIEDERISSDHLKEYDNHVELINDLLENKIDAAFVPSSYVRDYGEEFEAIDTKTKVIFEKSWKEEIEQESVPQKSVEEPFTMLIMGVDTTGNGVGTSFNGDALLLLTFNPKTLNTTILSIPRDSYMPISCRGDRKNKITNAGQGAYKVTGESCIKTSLENYFGIKIDYYAKINFKGVVDVVDTLGGIDLTIPYSFCEQNSARKWGKNTVFVKAGKQHLNGEQALAYARHRKVTAYQRSYCGASYVQNAGYWNDFVRGQHQQEVLKAIISKVSTISIGDFEKLLNSISKNFKSSMSTETILSFYKLGKKILGESGTKNQLFQMQRLYLSGYDQYIYDYSFKHKSGSKLNLYNFVIYDGSKEDVIHAMKVNLGLENAKPVKTFSFSINNKYEETIIGKGKYSGKSVQVMEDLVGKTLTYAENYASSHNLNIEINEVVGTTSQKVGQILKQSIPYLTDLDMLDDSRTLTLTVVTSIEQPVTPPVEENPEEGGDIPEEVLPTEPSNSNSNTNTTEETTN